jgi:hypothetical protein
MFYTAAKEAADGPNWASKLCSASRSLSLCQDPRQLAFVAGGDTLGLAVMFVSAIRDEHRGERAGLSKALRPIPKSPA